jgi:hypothetical protein
MPSLRRRRSKDTTMNPEELIAENEQLKRDIELLKESRQTLWGYVDDFVRLTDEFENHEIFNLHRAARYRDAYGRVHRDDQ